MVLKEMKINHAQVLFRGDYGADELIDVVLGNRVYTRALYCYNKCDLVSAILAVTAATPCCSIPPHWFLSACSHHPTDATGRLSLLSCRLFVTSQVSIEEIDRLAHLPDSIVCSSAMNMNFDLLLEKIWDYLALVRVYTKKQGQPPMWAEPSVMRSGVSFRQYRIVFWSPILLSPPSLSASSFWVRGGGWLARLRARKRIGH